MVQKKSEGVVPVVVDVGEDVRSEEFEHERERRWRWEWW
jgi:hypothetical protein